MSGILTRGRGAVEKRGGRGPERLGVVSFLSGVLLSCFAEMASAAAEPPSGWMIPPDEREKTVLSLKRQWSRDPSSGAIALELANHLFLTGRREEALRTLLATHAATSAVQERTRLESRVRVISRSFATVDGARNYQAGLNALLAGDFKPAIARFESVISSERQVLDAIVRKGQAELLLGRRDSAAESFRLARQLNPFEPEIRIWLGHALLARGEKDEGSQEIFSAWRLATPEQKGRVHWKAWLSQAQILQGRSGAAKSKASPEVSSEAESWTERSGWSLWVLQQTDLTKGPLVRRFLNLFPNGYQKLIGQSGLDLEWWSPRLLEQDRDGAGGVRGRSGETL